jgi:hypothetical protein
MTPEEIFEGNKLIAEAVTIGRYGYVILRI